MASWYRPATLVEALEIRSRELTVPMAGATDLYVRHRRGGGLAPAIEPPILSIGHLAEIREIRRIDGKLLIGAAVPYSEILAHPWVPEVLRASIRELAAPALRNAGTLGGNICNASPAADAVCPLYVLDARCELSTRAGMRSVPIAETIIGPGRTILADDELLTTIEIPGFRLTTDVSFYRKVGTRRANALSKLSIAAIARIRGSGAGAWIDSVAIALGAVGPTVLRSREIESLFVGEVGMLEAATPEIVAAYRELVSPIDDQRSTADYRREVAVNLVRQFIEERLSLGARP